MLESYPIQWCGSLWQQLAKEPHTGCDVQVSRSFGAYSVFWGNMLRSIKSNKQFFVNKFCIQCLHYFGPVKNFLQQKKVLYLFGFISVLD